MKQRPPISPIIHNALGAPSATISTNALNGGDRPFHLGPGFPMTRLPPANHDPAGLAAWEERMRNRRDGFGRRIPLSAWDIIERDIMFNPVSGYNMDQPAWTYQNEVQVDAQGQINRSVGGGMGGGMPSFPSLRTNWGNSAFMQTPKRPVVKITDIE